MNYNKVVCVGRNYAAHAKELNNPIPVEPILFMKPATTLVPLTDPIPVSAIAQPVHYELEVAVLLGKTLKNADEVDASTAIDAVGLALDLTLRELQNELKQRGEPWEKAKAFDGSCPVSAFIPIDNLDLTALKFELKINDEVRQQGDTSDMLIPIVQLIQYASRHFTLNAGDIILTGTPAGVGALNVGDKIEATLENKIHERTEVK
ncbi:MULTISPECIES: fumarylacetoacetate hydrolase family protein [Gammaproteobacteria]|uniref:fumarylacetoacetate hydrolase family protein n=1 Tax=Gammaproteobacteria TaxID=1236 RepID=UPI000DCFF8E2|nr:MULTISPECIES: fumarylacetoacetate hydrolase family protein [Gammaproteobacteria]RTE86921.1 fumarylacetoacetate hydrolase family protein [Aliidiomarina sp. B3213]TCZ93289.1 fumarylacetoacetate hydrolase family protein [Lysobacter sp. N42]